MASKSKSSKSKVTINNGVAAAAVEAENNNDASVVNMEDFMHCPVCNREFREPKMLPCLHSFCEECLESSLHQSEVSNYITLCDNWQLFQVSTKLTSLIT